jgi:5-methylcytosine-specific restriction endonuclease McrA
MARKQKHRGPPEGRRPKGSSRAQVVLSIVLTDSTFEAHRVGDNGWDVVWIGKCIHCGRKLDVSAQGGTDATVEHINPLCNGGEATDPRNLALACRGCNNEKGIRHDQHAGKGGRADEVITALQGRRLARWREPVTNS